MAASSYVQGGGRGDYPVQVLTYDSMGELGKEKIEPGRRALELGHESARGVSDVLPIGERDSPPGLPGSGQYVCQQKMTLTGTDIRNFNRSSKAKTGKVG